MTNLLLEASDELSRCPGRSILVAGGARLARHGLHEATRAVDRTTAIPRDLQHRGEPA